MMKIRRDKGDRSFMYMGGDGSLSRALLYDERVGRLIATGLNMMQLCSLHLKTILSMTFSKNVSSPFKGTESQFYQI